MGLNVICFVLSKENLISVFLIKSINNLRLFSLANFTVIIFEAPYAKERALSALRFAWTADLEGHTVKVWLFENGVHLAKKGQKPAQGLTNYGQMLEELVKGGVEVKACVVCAEARGIAPSELIEGVKLATIHELVEWTASSDKVISF
jgi:tRNA 2-thiouridine synthesizing protein D